MHNGWAANFGPAVSASTFAHHTAAQFMKVPHPHHPRREDHRLLTGKGRFVDDLPSRDACVGVVVRSDMAHANILAIDVSEAENMPGVHAVYTGRRLQAEGIGDLPASSAIQNRDGSEILSASRQILAVDTVRYVGEPIAFVVADTAYLALDAAEAVTIDYEELPAASDPEQALSEAAQIWPGKEPNLAFDWEMGDEPVVRKAFADAAHVVEIEVRHPRMAVCPIEPRAALGEYDAGADAFTLHAQTQGPHSVRDALAKHVLKTNPDKIRVVTQDVGGSFGMKIFPYPEYALVLLAARETGRPVKWTATRSESFLSDAHGRARTDRLRLALDSDAAMLALEIDAIADLGAYLSSAGALVPSVYAATVIGHCYRIPSVYFRSRGAYTNAPPTDAFRGAGKPEMVCALEQLIDKAAEAIGIDRIEIRRRNLVRTNELPYAMPNGQVIDSGDFERLLDKAAEISDWSGFAKRRQLAESHGKLRGIGLGMYMHSTSGAKTEVCEVTLNPDGTASVTSGTHSGGQGQETSLSALVAAVLDIDPADVEVVQGDTLAVKHGSGTGGSSMVAVAGHTAQRAAAAVLERARGIASEALEAAAADLEYGQGEFRVSGTDRSVSLGQAAAWERDHGSGGSCAESAAFEGENVTHPSGAYVAELECDPETGVVSVVQLAGIDDLGRILFPEIVEGQLHGGWAQSVGTALMESVEYDDAQGGQPMNATFMDYQLPRAADMPFFRLDKVVTLSRFNELGTKGAGEVACLGAPGALCNALSDLLRADTFASFEKPATPYRMWKRLRGES